MSKAEDRALEAYPSTSHYWNAEPDRNAEAREFYKQGYHQAEKDLELTWEDLKMIDEISDQVYAECDVNVFDEKEYYQEVLKRFKERKEK